jgi:hypothetical protein
MPPASPVSGFSVQIFQSKPGSCAMDSARPCMAALISAPQGPWNGKSICRRMGIGVSLWSTGAVWVALSDAVIGGEEGPDLQHGHATE